MLDSVRARLAAWYAAMFAILLAGFASVAFSYLRHQMATAVDEHLADTGGAVAGALAAERAHGRSDSAAVATILREFRFQDVNIAVYDPEAGTVRAANPGERVVTLSDSGEPLAPSEFGMLLNAAHSGDPELHTVMLPSGPVRMMTVPLRLHHELILGIAHSLVSEQKVLVRVRDSLLVAIPLGLALATLGGYLLARRAMQPVVLISDRASHIGASTLHERLPIVNPRDELGILTRTFNDLLERLAGSFDQQRQFIADASHELRTPIAIVSAEAELALARGRPAEEYRRALERVYDETRRLRRIVDSLFLLARADAGEALVVPREMYLDEIIEESVRAVGTLATRRGTSIEFASEEELEMRGDEGLLRRAVVNLLDNAVKYTEPGGTVRVRASRDNGAYVVDVEDSGTGIPPEAQPHIFERFFRGRRDRGTTEDDMSGGAGLGLAIARRIVELHGGQLTLLRSSAAGTVFRIRMPASKA